MTFRHIPLLLAGILLVGVQVAYCEKPPSSNKTWEEEASRSGLSETDISTLKKNRILITNEAYKQIFAAYQSGDMPLFITSDSLLNAYHVLYEESVLRLENARAFRLPQILKLILDNLKGTDDHLKGKPELVSAAKRRAMLVTGIALRLMDDSFRFKEDELNAILDEETKRIVRAEGVEMPQWLGKPEGTFMALDYSRYKPRGFYTRSERLERYFRAVSWLQSIPFRIGKDEELLAILMLGNSVTYNRFDDYEKKQEIDLFFRVYSAFIGAGDNWDIIDAAQRAQNNLRMDLNKDDLQEKRDRLTKAAEGYGKGPLISDQIRFAPSDPKTVAEPHFRILSPYCTPSAILFQRTTDIRRFNRPYPNGLEMAAALGSTFARENLSDPQKKDLLETIDSCQPIFQGENSLYLLYLHALEALLDKPERDAPDFMKNEAWQRKSCNTVLAGWAQLRHTWALQAKQNVYYLGGSIVPEGFVEPNPKFFSRMADLAEITIHLLKQSGAFDPDYTQLIESIEKFKGIIEGVKNEKELEENISKMPQEDMMFFELPYLLMITSSAKAKAGSEAYFKEKAKWFDSLVADIKKGRIDKHPKLKAIIEKYRFDLDKLWNRFEKTSRRLEVIAHKQLRGVDLSNREIAFIKSYGNTIAGIMLYGGNSYLTPRDDSPRVVDVYANPQKGGYLLVGIARPRKLYVLYPWKDKTILCKGAVMPYYEFEASSRLTNKSWKKRLDSKNRPSIPKWMSSIVSGESLNKPKLKDEH